MVSSVFRKGRKTSSFSFGSLISQRLKKWRCKSITSLFMLTCLYIVMWYIVSGHVQFPYFPLHSCMYWCNCLVNQYTKIILSKLSWYQSPLLKNPNPNPAVISSSYLTAPPSYLWSVVVLLSISLLVVNVISPQLPLPACALTPCSWPSRPLPTRDLSFLLMASLTTLSDHPGSCCPLYRSTYLANSYTSTDHAIDLLPERVRPLDLSHIVPSRIRSLTCPLRLNLRSDPVPLGPVVPFQIPLIIPISLLIRLLP